MMKFLTVKPGDTLSLAAPGALPEQVHVFEEEGIEAINAALAARRPLLVRGEPGVGKSQLARAAAKALRRVYIPYVVDARTESRDMLWHFDAVERLAEAQLSGALKEDTSEVRKRLAIGNYLRPGPLWWAFDWFDAAAQAERVGAPAPIQRDGGTCANGCVVLLDEIDKAESEVPNGLLEALGAGEFTPLGRTEPVIAAKSQPLVVITTNEERALPDAFVRRCMVLHLDLPALPEKREALVAWLEQRGRAHFSKASGSVLTAAAEQLVTDRQEAIHHHWLPLPGQAEYLDLVRAILELAPDDLTAQETIIARIARYALKKHTGAA